MARGPHSSSDQGTEALDPVVHRQRPKCTDFRPVLAVARLEEPAGGLLCRQASVAGVVADKLWLHALHDDIERQIESEHFRIEDFVVGDAC